MITIHFYTEKYLIVLNKFESMYLNSVSKNFSLIIKLNIICFIVLKTYKQNLYIIIFLIIIYYQIKLYNYFKHMYLIYICVNNYGLFFIIIYSTSPVKQEKKSTKLWKNLLPTEFWYTCEIYLPNEHTKSPETYPLCVSLFPSKKSEINSSTFYLITH